MSFPHHHIIGIGRSGTTLLQSILNTHSAVWAGPENYFIPFFYSAWKDKTTFTAADLELACRFHRAFGVLQPYVGFTFDEQKFLNPKGLQSFNDFIKHTYQAFIDHVSPEKIAAVYINKNPLHSLYLEELAILNSETYFVWVMRDYRANVHSRKKSVHLKSTNTYYNMLRWLAFEQRIKGFQQKHPERVLIIRYEDLVTDKEETMRKVTAFLRISTIDGIEDALLPYQTVFKNEVESQYQGAERMEKRFGDLAKPIYDKAIDQWKTGLSPNEIAICDVLAGNVGQRYGYDTMSQTSTMTSISIRLFAILTKCWILIEQVKDSVFQRLPITFKVTYFERWVTKIDKKRQAHVVR